MKYERTSSSPRMAVEESHEDVKRRGRRVVATTALQPGDAIYATPPDLAVLYSPFASHICARCLVAEVNPEDKVMKKHQHAHPHQQKGKGSASQALRMTSPKSNPPSGVGSLNTTGLASSSFGGHSGSGVAGDFLSSTPGGTTSTTATALTAAVGSASGATEAVACPQDPYFCPHCDQFVLCASCVSQLVLEVELIAAAEADEKASRVLGSSGGSGCGSGSNIGSGKSGYISLLGAGAPVDLHHKPDAKALLLRHPTLRAHAISCAWYVSLPESIRAPGNDTDFLRFCLDYGARVQLGDTTMVAALNKLDTNAAVQSKEAHHLCEVFARDRVVATFGPRKTAPNSSGTGNYTSPLQAGASAAFAHAEDAFSALAARTALLHDSAPVFPPPYPVAWTDLRDVLLRTRCNSLGFPFTTAETIGWSLQETVCMLNHSCVPNAAVVMLYDEADARRAQQAEANAGGQEDLSGGGGSAGGSLEGGERGISSSGSGRGQDRLLHSQQQQQLHRRRQRLSVSPPRESATMTYKGRNLNSYRAIAVSSPSPFSTSYTESLQGWIGIQATRPIAAGEEITVSYIDLEVFGDDVQARSRHLLEQYRFLCTCELCTRQRGRKL